MRVYGLMCVGGPFSGLETRKCVRRGAACVFHRLINPVLMKRKNRLENEIQNEKRICYSTFLEFVDEKVDVLETFAARFELFETNVDCILPRG